MRKGFLLAGLLAMLALCVVLVGCGSTGNAADAAKNFVGTWEIDGLISDGKESSEDELAIMKAMGVYLTLEDGGKATLEMLGTPVEGTWEGKDATTALLRLDEETAKTANLSNEPAPLKYADNKITMSSESTSMTFIKIDPSQKGAANLDTLVNATANEVQSTVDAAAPDLSAQLSDSQPLDITIADDDYCTIRVTAVGDYFGDPGYALSVTNKTEGTLHVDDNNEFSINGAVTSPIFSLDVPAGQTATEILWFENSEINNGGVAALSGVEGQLIISSKDGEDLEQLETYDFVVNQSE